MSKYRCKGVQRAAGDCAADGRPARCFQDRRNGRRRVRRRVLGATSDPPISFCHCQAHPAGLPGADRRLRRPSRENKAVTVGSDNPGPGVLEDIDVFDTIVSNLHK
ncbi:MAG: hypothetical protein K0S68_955 [Candidatus Saccharibacteria bacterium]|nr:hypothetical protein [Candidatus Saccharibacteria bacterium]